MAKKVLLVFFILQLAFLPLYAQEDHDKREKHGPLRKLSRGLINTAFGWVEIPKQMIKVKQETGETTGDVVGFTWGPLRGLAYFVGRTAIGALEMVTFAIPEYDPIIEPEFILSGEEEE